MSQRSSVLDEFEAELSDDPQSVFDACVQAREEYPLENGLSRCSDIHIALSFKAVLYRVDGQLVPMQGAKLPSKTALDRFVQDIEGNNNWVKEQLNEFGAVSVSHWGEKFGRLRVTVLKTHENTLQIRLLPEGPPPWEALNLPPQVKRLFDTRKGLSFICGLVSSGKSTLLAAMTDGIVREHAGSVLSVDDTQEYSYKRRKGIVYSVEIGAPGQARSYQAALKNALNSDINALVVGQSRTPDVMEMVLQTASAGPRTATTIHVRGGIALPDRVIGSFTPEAQPQIRQMLANNLEEILYITLVPRKDGQGRVPACEFLYRMDDLADAILDDKGTTANSVETALKNYVAKHSKEGMMLLEDHLFELVEKQAISREDALAAALRPQELRKKFGLDEGSDRRTMVQRSDAGASSGVKI